MQICIIVISTLAIASSLLALAMTVETKFASSRNNKLNKFTSIVIASFFAEKTKQSPVVKFKIRFFFFAKFIKFGSFLNSLKFTNLHYRYFNFGDCFEPVGSRNDNGSSFEIYKIIQFKFGRLMPTISRRICIR